jgi:hypothetical protein
MAEQKTWAGGCHCGKVRFELETDLATVVSCNCSICQKKGHLLTFVPAPGFALRSGEAELTDYQFNTHTIHHLFCRTCGVQSFSRGTAPDGTDMVAVNVRCLDGIDLAALTVTPFDGRSR